MSNPTLPRSDAQPVKAERPWTKGPRGSKKIIVDFSAEPHGVRYRQTAVRFSKDGITFKGRHCRWEYSLSLVEIFRIARKTKPQGEFGFTDEVTTKAGGDK